jgi:hypothetical protein
MKAKFFLAATLMLALAIGSANANPVLTSVNATTAMSSANNGNHAPVKHHHHRKHRRHHVVRH